MPSRKPAPDVICIDFETDAIGKRPEYPPKPVGFSIQFPGEKKSQYYAWDHPDKNNTDKKNATRQLDRAWKAKHGIVFHNGKFDVDVAETHMGMNRLPWERIHDTMFLAFLCDPHAPQLGLKPLAEDKLGMKPDERDTVREWLVEHGVCRSNDKQWGAHIAKAPADIVGRYADGDVKRTLRLFKYFYGDVRERGMMRAYQREQEIMPIFMDNEREGIRVDIAALRRDIPMYEKVLVKVDNWLREELRAPKLNIDSDAELADILYKRKIVTTWDLTPTGRRSTSKKSMTPDRFRDPKIASALGYRNRLVTCLGTFMKPWLEMAEATGGTVNTQWNQVRQARGADGRKGTRTGRPSTNDPNFLNIPKSFADRGDGYVHPKFLRVPELPLVRDYALADKGGDWLHRDYNQQELRILAHFEDGPILKAYLDNPKFDIHTLVQNEVKRIASRDLPRLPIKMLNFGRVYGEGLGGVMERLKIDKPTAVAVRNAQSLALPGLAKIEKEVKAMGKSGEPIVTWGGRQYYTEPPFEKDGRKFTFEYKLLNYLVQGSAADCTKEALIRYHKAKKNGRFLVTVYDEINITAPSKAAPKEMKILRECMESIELDLPLLSDGKMGPSWGKQTKCD